jgi:hypothetical protein
MRMMKRTRAFTLLFLLAALLSMGLIYYATMAGPGVGGDATIYLTSARGLLSGQGLGWVEADGSFRLLPYTPPFYPLALAGVGLLFPDLVAGARWLNILLAGATAFVFGLVFYRRTAMGLMAALLAGSVAASPVLVGVQVWAMSEALFLFLGFAGLFVLLAYLERPRPGLLPGAALLCGLAFLTRYIGVAFVAAGAVGLLMMARADDTRLRMDFRRLREALVFGAIAVLPMLIWLAVDFFLSGTVGSRSGQPASAYFARFLEMGPALERIVLFWLLPESIVGRLPGPVRVALWALPLAALVFLFAAALRRGGRSAPTEEPPLAGTMRLAVLLALFVAIYLVVLAGVQVFTYPPVTLASRMLSPVHLAVLGLAFALFELARRLYVPRSRAVLTLFGLGALALFSTYALRGALVARDYHAQGIGYQTAAWRESSTLKAARTLGPFVPIISNETTAIMYFLNRPAYPLQEIYQEAPLAEFLPYGSGEDASQRAFREQGAALVLFHNTLYEDFAKYGERAEERIRALKSGLRIYYESDDGGIYFAPGNPAAGSADSLPASIDDYCY